MIGDEIKFDGKTWVEITEREWIDSNEFGMKISFGLINNSRYFKRKETFPIVFEDESYKIEVNRDWVDIKPICRGTISSFTINCSLPILVEAVEKWKELQDNNYGGKNE